MSEEFKGGQQPAEERRRNAIGTGELGPIPERILQARAPVVLTEAERMRVPGARKDILRVVMNRQYADLASLQDIPTPFFNTPEFQREFLFVRETQAEITEYFRKGNLAPITREVEDMLTIQAICQGYQNAITSEEARQTAHNFIEGQKDMLYDTLLHTRSQEYGRQRLPSVVNEQIAAGEDPTLILIDIDYMKRYNDGLPGKHVQTDNEVMRPLGKLLELAFRNGVDIVVRKGGDEIVVVFKGTPQQAAEAAERLQVEVRQFLPPAPAVDDKPAQPVASLSVGISSGKGTSYDDLLEECEAALYDGKKDRTDEEGNVIRKGRGHTVVFDDSMRGVERKPLER